MSIEPNQLELTIGLIGGLALFLFGMEIMTRALKQVAGASPQTILARMTENRFLELLAGASVTLAGVPHGLAGVCNRCIVTLVAKK